MEHVDGARNTFSSKLGFVLAAAGSAVGLGNIWRFPYLAAKYGGGSFLLLYILFTVTFGFAIMVLEIAMGRKTGLSPIGAFTALNKKYKFIGILACLVVTIIMPYYGVIGGWVLKYMSGYMLGAHAEMAQSGYFEAYIGKTVEPVLWQLLFVVIGSVIVIAGVKKGIENVSKVLMPALVVLTAVVAIYACTRPGAWEGVKYFLIPDFSKLDLKCAIAAMGQMFYSMSLAMGIMITYGSYLSKEESIDKSVKTILGLNTGIAITAGLMVIPAVFAFSGGDESALNAGAGLMFITLPKVFETMSLSSVIGLGFFVLVFFAALTSFISIMETVVSTVCDELKLSRKTSSLLVAAFAIIVGVLPSLGFGIWKDFTILGFSILDFMDFISNSLLMPFVALCTTLFAGFVIKPKTFIDEVKLNSEFKSEKMFVVLIKYVSPIFMVVILVTYVLKALGIIDIIL